MIRESKLTDRIICLGQRNDVPALMKLSDLQVIGLIRGIRFDGFRSSSMRNPDYRPQIGGLDEAIKDGITGMLVERCSSQALAAATIWLLDHPDQREIMGEAARTHVVEDFNSEKQIQRLMDIFENDSKARF